MAPSPSFAVVQDPRTWKHRGPADHPERPERLSAVAEALDARSGAWVGLPARPAEDGELLRVHSRSHLAALARAVERAPCHLDADTFVSSGSLLAARVAAGASIDLAHKVLRGELRAGFAAVRPPGHHAERSRAMGFCLLNNAAVAVRALQAEEGEPRVLLVDWDVHHGNGSQHSFESDPGVLYFSTHQFPFYPGTGAFEEVGVGPGEGTTVNLPLPAGCGDLEYTALFQRVLVPVAQHFRPDLILVSAGFDAHRADPLASMQLTQAGYRALAVILRHLAEQLCGGRLVFLLEGGYAAAGLREGVSAVLEALLPETPAALPAPVPMPPGSLLERLVERAVGIHRRFTPGLGAI